jgi:serine protease
MERHHLVRPGRVVAALLVLVVSALALTTGTPAHAAGPDGHGPRAAKPKHAKISSFDSPELVEVKFAEGTDVRLRGNRFVSKDGGKIAALDAALAPFPGLKASRLFESQTEDDLDSSRHDAETRSGEEQPDMNLFFRIRTGPKTDIVALLDALNALDIVENAAPAQEPVPVPATASFAGRQGYRTAATTGGIDADFVQSLPGGKGENVGIIDIEYSWNRTHEDLGKLRASGSLIANGTPCDNYNSTDHGTAVIGELAGDPNGFGVTGLAPSASIRTVNASRRDSTGACIWDLANAINLAAANSAAGDVILIEQQTAGPRKTGQSDVGLMPVEWYGPVWTAIKNATSRGVIVIEPAGNGYQNLDDPVYNTTSGLNWFSYDSGAIMVGAGNSPGCTSASARSRLDFSNYGSRLNVQGWGNCVTTTGYGNLQGGTDPNAWYTWSFNGTSSASPIVASAAALLSSIAKARGTTLTPATVRSLLASTGQSQTAGLAGNIGPLPNLRAAVDTLGPKLAETEHVVAEGGTLGAANATVPVRNTWTSSGSAPARYEVYLATDGGTFVKQTITDFSASNVFQLARGHDYQFAARAVDAAGMWGDWAYGPKFNLGEYQENYGSTPTYTGTWLRSAWSSASDGYLTVSDVAGSRASFTFTGTNVAWIATKATNRGAADIYVDGLYAKTVDLYSTTTMAQYVAFTKTWATSSTHTIEVRVRGTAGRPKVDVDAFIRLR